MLSGVSCGQAVQGFNGVAPPSAPASPSTGALSATSIAFSAASAASVPVGSSLPWVQAITLTNTGGGSLSISSLPFSGTNASDFSTATANYLGQTTSCTTSTVLTANQSCNLVITFTPGGNGARSGTLTINSSASNTPQTIALTGTGVAGTGIAACGSLSAATNYFLTADVSAAGTCFSAGNGSLLNLNGHTATYGTANQGSAVFGVNLSTNNSGFKMFNGTLSQGAGTLANGSHVVNGLNVVLNGGGPVIFGVNSTWNAPQSLFLLVDLAGSQTDSSAFIHDNALTNQNSTPCGAVNCRDQLQSAIMHWTESKSGNANPPQIYSNTITGGPQGGIASNFPGTAIFSNKINPGSASTSITNDFGLWCWNACNYHDNTISSPVQSFSNNRGIQISNADGAGNDGALVVNNQVTARENANNAEYGGCELGGTYGLQWDDNPTGTTSATGNGITALADQCPAGALRLTDQRTTTGTSTSNTYKAQRVAPGSVGHAYGIELDQDTAGVQQNFVSTNDFFTADTAILLIDVDGCGTSGGVDLFANSTLNKGINPEAGWHTVIDQAGPFTNPASTHCTAVHFRDAIFGSGVSPTDAIVPAQDANHIAVSVFWDWTQTINCTKASGPACNGASVTFTDTLSNTYTGTTNSSGAAAVVVTQYRNNNDTTPNATENRNPYGLSISLAGCTTNTQSGLTISAPATRSIVLAGC